MADLDLIIKNMNKKAKENIVTIGLTDYDYERIPFTSPRMNYCTFGGLPIGKLVEFFGEEHGGKTTTALDVIANYQLMDNSRKVLYIDAENTLDTEWAKKLSVNLDDMVIMKPTSQSAEEIFQFILDAIDTGEIGLVIIDSLGVLVSAQSMEKSIEDKTYAGISMALTTFGNKAEMLCQRHKCTIIGINQLRDDLSGGWGGPKTPGGRAWKHLCCVRMQFSRGKFLDINGAEVSRSVECPSGNIVMMSMVKNKSCPPTRRTGFYTLNYNYGIDYLNDLIEVAIKYGIVEKSGAWFSIVDIESGEILEGNMQGQRKVYEYLEDESNSEVLTRIEELIDKKVQEE